MGRSDSLVFVAGRDDVAVARLDPRWKLAAAAVAVGAALSLRSPFPVAAGLVASLLPAISARPPARWFAARVAGAALAVALFALPLPFILDSSGHALRFGPLRFSPYGAQVGLLLVGRALTVVVVTLTLLATTPPDALLKAARRLGVPGVVVQVAMMTYRYLFVLSEELGRLRVAVRARGFRNRSSRHAYATAGRVAGALLVRSHERADRVYQAMRCRGFDGRFRSLTAFRTGTAELAAFALVVLVAAGLVVLDRLVF